MRRLFYFFLMILSSCSNDKTYDKMDLYELGSKIDPTIEIVLPKDLASGITCAYYGQGCVRAIQVKHRDLIMIFVEFENQEQAIKYGKSINSFILRNWLIDDALGEPVLERFIYKAFSEVKKASEM